MEPRRAPSGGLHRGHLSQTDRRCTGNAGPLRQRHWPHGPLCHRDRLHGRGHLPHRAREHWRDDRHHHPRHRTRHRPERLGAERLAHVLPRHRWRRPLRPMGLRARAVGEGDLRRPHHGHRRHGAGHGSDDADRDEQRRHLDDVQRVVCDVRRPAVDPAGRR